MKRILLSTLCCFVCVFSLQAQILFGTTMQGGIHKAGTFNKLTVSTNNVETVYSLEGDDGRDPQYTRMIQTADGKLYGMTFRGGSNSGGTIFSYDPSTTTFTKLKNFGDNGFFDFPDYEGADPYGSLVEASDGKLYGMAGGGMGWGVIFSFDPSTLKYIKLKEFDPLTTGSHPRGDLVQGSDGKLYGMTSSGGGIEVPEFPGDYYDLGVVFSFDPLSLTYRVLKTFTGKDGHSPQGSLVQLDNGKLYGMTATSIFSLDPVTAVYTLLYDFNTGPGKNATGNLTKAGNGKLYGRAKADDTPGQDIIFSFDPATSVFTVVKDYAGNSHGSLEAANDGRLYGLSYSDSPGNDGFIFSFDPATASFMTVHNFNNADGSRPLGSLLQAADGKLYGMTADGGSHDRLQNPGVIFSFDPSSSVYTKLKNFGDNIGSWPNGALILANNGKLYGMTSRGGTSDSGTIFSYDTLTSTYSKLKDFGGLDGAQPWGNLFEASDGKLYGMTHKGGTGAGVIFSYDPLTSVYAVLHKFNNDDGAGPYGSIVEATNGKLYGMTHEGGINNLGVIFSFDPLSSVYTKLRDLSPEDGTSPYGNLLAANDGKLYGMAHNEGNHGYGTIFSIDPSTSAFTKLHDFRGYDADGSSPYGSLIQASNGKIYGVTSSGGRRDHGAIFSFDPITAIYKMLGSFDIGNTGYDPRGTLLQASDGKLYGMSDFGVYIDHGSVFSFDIVSSTLSKVQDIKGTQDLNGINGAYPSYGSAFIEVPECTTSTAYYKDADGDGYGNPYSRKIALRKPSGYVTNNKDCDDRKKAVHPITYYRDADGDSFGDANVSVTICDPVAPAGYAKNKIDDDDRRKIAYKISNYPNPFKETSSIKYALPFDSKVSVIVYDMSGKPVATLVNENKKAGFYTVSFNAGGLSGGILYYKITANSKDQHFEQTNKMVSDSVSK